VIAVQERVKQGERAGTPKESQQRGHAAAGGQAVGAGPLWAAPPAIRLGGAPVQRLVLQGEAGGSQENLGERIQARSGSGQPLEPGVQRQLEAGLGADLSAARVHTDGEADRMARSVNAVAFTSGADMYFQSGTYSPGSSGGLKLLAHEAAHTVQQAAGPVSGTPTAGGVKVSDPGDSFERAAEQAAERATAVKPAP
jgi:hypothetical protein